MTTKADFTTEEWELILEGPTQAGMMVAMGERGGTFRETFSMSKAYADARGQHGGSELIDEIIASKPKVDRTKHSNYAELKDYGVGKLRDAIAVLEAKASSDEVDGYRSFVLALAQRVAAAHEEHGEKVSDAERAVLADIAGAVGASADA